VRTLLWPEHGAGRANALIATLVFLFTLGVYGYCLYPTTPYWDSGEYIATSYILGIPHPPGTPLYVLIGRLFAMLPFATPAVLVNFLSAFSAALAVLFTYLITVRLVRRNFLAPAGGAASGSVSASGSDWIGWTGGVVAALFMAFSPTFWDNAVEAEVYASSSAIACLCVWLGLLWWDRQGEARNDRILWLILYILFLAIGIHMGTFLVFPCIYLLVTMVHWERVNKGAFWSSIGLFLLALLIRTAVVSTINDVDARIVELSMAPRGVQSTAGLLDLVMVAALAWNLVAVLGTRFAVGIIGLAVLGVSVHLYLLIRSNLDPGINEGDPSTLDALMLMLSRDQYKPPEAIFRKADLWYQFTEMYLRYFGWQFHLFQGLAGKTYLIPVALGLFGAFLNAFRDRKSFALMGTLFLITGPFLVWYLNFREGEVRERDYFFVANFHFFTIWIGMGAAALVQWAAEVGGAAKAAAEGATRGGLRSPVAVATALALVGVSTLPLAAGEGNDNFFRHNRRENWIAHNFAHNMLVGLEKDAILFTNGDNDTFPLWYLQEVEGFRRDVRVICLSLLNTDWCIRQIRDLEPKVPVSLSDAEIEALSPYRDQSGRIVLVKDIMVRHILEKNRWQRPIYMAVTVPDQMGLEQQLVMEGLVFRVHPTPQAKRIDPVRTKKNLEENYLYRGFLTATGDWDSTVYKDTQSTNLLQNYAAANVQLALALYEEGKLQDALAVLERTRKMSPHFPGVVMALGYVYERLGRWEEARAHYEAQLKVYPGDAALTGQLGSVLAQLGDTTRAIALLEEAIQREPGVDFEPYASLVNLLYNRGEAARAVSLLEQWLRYHPDDTRAKQSLAEIRRRTGGN
jgi:hypothetical protein